MGLRADKRLTMVERSRAEQMTIRGADGDVHVFVAAT